MKKMNEYQCCVLIAGSSGGIGTAISEVVLRSGMAVIGMDIAPAPKLLAAHHMFTEVRVDITDRNRCASAMREHVPEHGLTAVVYAAGIYDHFPLAEAQTGRLEQILAVNIMGFAEIVNNTFSRIFAEKGRYIVISSETALVPMPFQVYGTSKRMLEVYLDALRQELSFLGLPVITVRPGAHDTALLRKSLSKLGDYPDSSLFKPFLDIVRKRGEEVIQRGASDPSDVAEVVLKALTDKDPKSSYHVNVALHFRVLKLLPDRLVRSLFKWVLGK